MTKTKEKTSIKIKPLGDRLIVERDEAEGMTKGGIVLPDSGKEVPVRGTVICVGEGRLQEDGTRRPLEVKAGDRIIFSLYSGEKVKIDETEYTLMREDDVLAVIQD